MYVHLWFPIDIENVVSRDNWLIMCCGSVDSRWAGRSPGKNSGFSCGPFCPVNMWWVCRCCSKLHSSTSESRSSIVILPRVSSFLFSSVCKFILLEAVICKLSISLGNTLWSVSNRTLASPYSDYAITDFIANSSIRIIKFSFALITASFTLVFERCHHTFLFTSHFTNNAFFKCVHIHLWTINLTRILSTFVSCKEVSLSAALALLSVWD